MGKKHFINKKGFTLIELMVVIAVIGILTGIVLIGLRSSEKKSKDANIKSLMYQIKTIAEEYYLDNFDYEGVCDNSNTLSDVGKFGIIEQNIKKYNNNQEVFCFLNEEKTIYAVSSPLVSSEGKYLCVSSLGEMKELNHQITTSTCQ